MFRQPHGSPFLSLGVHLDWHTPTLDLHVLVWTVQVGRNVWQDGRRFVYSGGGVASGHTDHCQCFSQADLGCGDACSIANGGLS